MRTSARWSVRSVPRQRAALRALERELAHEDVRSRRRRLEAMIRQLRRALALNGVQNVSEAAPSA